MRVILIGNLQKHNNLNYVFWLEKVYTRQGYSTDSSVCNFKHFLPGFDTFSDHVYLKYSRKLEALNGTRVALRFDTWHDTEVYGNRCRLLSGNQYFIITVMPENDYDSALLQKFNDYLDKEICVGVGKNSAHPTKIRDLNEYVTYVWERTKAEIIRQLDDENSPVRDIYYHNDHVPNSASYSDFGAQGEYLRRYAYAYVYMYYECYSKLIELCPELSNIHVLSLGCGVKLDGFGLRLATWYGERKPRFQYLGVDYSDWTNHGFDLQIKGDDFYRGSAETVFTEYPDYPYNTVIFPYSISEFDDEMLGKIADGIRDTGTENLYMIFTYRVNNNGNSDVDKNNADKFMKILNDKAGYAAELVHEQKYPWPAEGQENLGIASKIQRYPENVRPEAGFQHAFYREPMKHLKYINYAIYKLTK